MASDVTLKALWCVTKTGIFVFDVDTLTRTL